jgi:hypothetical protein
MGHRTEGKPPQPLAQPFPNPADQIHLLPFLDTNSVISAVLA